MNIYDSYVELVYGFELTDVYQINQIKRVINYLKDNGIPDENVMKYLLKNGPVFSDAMFTGLTINTVYYNNELVIESPAPIWHPEREGSTYEYYREPRCNFDMDNLIDLFYGKLKIPYELQDRKREAGAFNHMLNKYKFTYFTALDFIITMIKLAAESEERVVDVFSIEKFSNEAYNMLMTLVDYGKTVIVWRAK